MTLGITPQTQISFMILVQLLHSFLLLFTCLLQLHYIQLTLMGPLRCRSPQYIFFDFIPVIPPLTRSPLIVSLFYLRSQRPFIPHHHTFFPKIVLLTLKVFTLHRVLHNPVKLCISCLDMITSSGAHNAFPPHPAILGILVFCGQLSHKPIRDMAQTCLGTMV